MENVFLKLKLKKKLVFNSLIWLCEETYKLKCDKNILLVENGNFISKNFEIIPNIISKTAGIISVSQKNNIIEEIAIKAGFVYQGKQFEQLDKKVYYPGEIIFEDIVIYSLSYVEFLKIRNYFILLMRPINLYNITKSKEKTPKIETKDILQQFNPTIQSDEENAKKQQVGSLKKRNDTIFFKNYDFFETRGKLENF